MARVPSPRKGDMLIRSDLPDWRNNACLNFMHDGNQTAYSEGYRRGAQRLVQHVIETQSDQDFLVYPIIFLYRHHIELVLKRLIRRAPSLIGRPLTEDEENDLKRHRLDLLWQNLEPKLREVCQVAGWKSPNHEDFEGIGDYIRQLVKRDPESYSFRYAHSKRGAPSLPKRLKHVNLRHFAEMMERLAICLDGIDYATSHLLELKAEWQDEVASALPAGGPVVKGRGKTTGAELPMSQT
ncbi:MAG: hypothetical protein JWO59_1647 [Chloroflexi bacterium]|nr:hypothetical protein [Chloroflexota bacterium]